MSDNIFTEEYVNAYKSIKAPDSLLSRVAQLETRKAMAMKTRSRKILRRTVSGIAACFLLIAVIAVFLHSSHAEPSLIYGDTVVGTELMPIYSEEASAAAFGMKRISQSGIPLTITAKNDTKVSVSDGKLLVYDSKSEELLSVVTDITVTKETPVKWDISEVTEAAPTLILEWGDTITVYTLEFGDEGYTLRQNGSE